jgi:hypothetical protein
MPPGGFRLAIVNGWNLAAGQAARATLDCMFRGPPSVGPQQTRVKTDA